MRDTPPAPAPRPQIAPAAEAQSDYVAPKPHAAGAPTPEALARLNRALGELIVDGIDTTLPLFHALLAEEAVQTGDYNIHWLEKWLETNLA